MNLYQHEIDRFRALADRWWDPEGDMRPLHDINPVRLDYIVRRAAALPAAGKAKDVPLKGLRVLDIGCGGGLISEHLARLGAEVLGIDMAEELLEVARAHAAGSGEQVPQYRHCAAEELLAEKERWHLITCMEVIEHVPDPAALVRTCAELLQPGGQAVFATLNRTPLSFATAIVGAEYLLRLLPRGTHRYDMLIRPSELAAWGREAGLRLEDLTGMAYNPLLRTARLTRRTDINYMATFGRP